MFAVGSVRRFGAVSYELCGVRVSVGRRSWAVFATCSRAAYRAGVLWWLEDEEFRPLRRSRRWDRLVVWWR
ncbi:hypothetical protein [Streptomyces sp. bgisy060]|uniref:hypothetical protein n=1 Tax=Streptomyces sp. bgisy060 TaxID=3413775 RepID=UPI003EC13782